MMSVVEDHRLMRRRTMALKKHDEALYTTSDLARAVGVSGDAIRLWDRKGILAPRRTASGTRIYTDADRRAAQAYRQSRVAV
jgi:predicted site-specific integrase-resolvase